MVMENNNEIEDKNKTEEIIEEKAKINFWHWYFPNRPIIFLRFLLFCYFIQWFIWNIITFVNIENLKTIFFLQKTWEGLGGITIVFGPILGTAFILVATLPLIMAWVFYAMSVSKWEIRDPALRIWAGIGVILSPFFSILFFMFLSLILGVVY